MPYNKDWEMGATVRSNMDILVSVGNGGLYLSRHGVELLRDMLNEVLEQTKDEGAFLRLSMAAHLRHELSRVGCQAGGYTDTVRSDFLGVVEWQSAKPFDQLVEDVRFGINKVVDIRASLFKPDSDRAKGFEDARKIWHEELAECAARVEKYGNYHREPTE